MLFNSFTFLFFLVMAFSGYWWLGKTRNGRRAQNVFLLLASYIFYGWWDPRFLSLIVLSSAVDYFCGRKMGMAKGKAAKRPYLYLSLAVNLGMLGFFKYFDFFSTSLETAFLSVSIQLSTPTLDLVLPVGISFYTFQTLSYTLDIYKSKLAPCRDPIAFFAFVSFFPQLVAGPIERARDLIPQFTKARKFDYGFAVAGLRLMLWGFFKKMVVGDRVGEYVDMAYAAPEEYSGLSVAVAGLFFCIQLYCDFSGYSDIAVGTARLFGFDLSINFRNPYLAHTFHGFWARWHITLTGWFRDYLYVPLGGNRRGKNRMYFNIFLVFLVSGLWHGAAWGFILWGALHGIYYMLERLAGLDEGWENWGLKWMGWSITMLGVWFANFFFRGPKDWEWWRMMKRLGQGGELDLFVDSGSELTRYMSGAGEMVYLMVLIAAWWMIEVFLGRRDFATALRGQPAWLRWSLYYGIALWLLLFSPYGIPERFIYFQF